MNLGWSDAVHLDRELAAALAAGGPIDVFAAYDRSRRTAALRATRQAAFNMRMGAPASGVRLAHAVRGRARARAAGPARAARPVVHDAVALAPAMVEERAQPASPDRVSPFRGRTA